MATQVQFRRGNTANMSTFTGAAGEITVDTDKKVIVVHDGSTAGGIAGVSAAQLSGNLSGYVTTTNLTNNLANYVTSTNLTNNLANYTTTTNLTNNLVNYQTTAGLNANIASYLPTYAGVVNGSSHTVGTSFTANSTVVNAVSYYAGTTLIGNTTGPYGKTEATLNVNSALTSNNSSYLGGTAAASYALSSSLSSYQTTAGLSANVATLTANNASYLGGTAAASYVTTTSIGGLTANNANYLGGTAAASYALTSSLSAYMNTSSAYTITGVHTYTANLAANSYLISNGPAYGLVGTLTDGANVAMNLASFNNWSLTLAGNRNLDNPTNPTAGQSGVIWVTQDATGSRTLTFGSYWKFPGNTAPTLTTTASAVDLIVYTVKSSTNITAQCITNIG